MWNVATLKDLDEMEKNIPAIIMLANSSTRSGDANGIDTYGLYTSDQLRVICSTS